MFLWTVAISGLLYIIGYIIKDIIKLKKDKLIGAKAYPILGNGAELMGNSHQFFLTLAGYFKEFGPRFRFYVGQQLFLVLCDPEDSEVVLSGQEFIQKADEYNYFHPWLGTGLLTSTGNKWRSRRKMITPAFHFKILEHFLEVFDNQSDILVEKLKGKADGKILDIFPDITLCTLDIICEASMGVSVNAQNDSESEYVKAVKTMCRIVNGRQRNILKRWNETFLFTNDFWEQKRALKILHGFTDNMIKIRKEKLKELNEDLESYTSETGTKKKLAFLDLLLLSKIDGKPLSDSSIREEVDTFLFEGHDTTSSGISFTVFELSKHPNIQERLYKEQLEVMGHSSQSATYADLQNMKLLEMAIKEGLRLYPPVPMYARKVIEPTMINDMHVPGNSTVVVHAYNMQRNPKIFPDPDVFNLDRQSPEESSKRNPFAQVPFSAGPRNCIGQKFAMLEMKSSLSKLIRNFKFEPSHEEVELTIDIIMKSANGIKVKLIRRE